jgi:hypothetical protein
VRCLTDWRDVTHPGLLAVGASGHVPELPAARVSAGPFWVRPGAAQSTGRDHVQRGLPDRVPALPPLTASDTAFLVGRFPSSVARSSSHNDQPLEMGPRRTT